MRSGRSGRIGWRARSSDAVGTETAGDSKPDCTNSHSKESVLTSAATGTSPLLEGPSSLSAQSRTVRTPTEAASINSMSMGSMSAIMGKDTDIANVFARILAG